VVHGDLKAGNVLLTSGGADPDGLWLKLTGSRRRLVAKVADFGLSTVLGPTDTHASLTARVSASSVCSVFRTLQNQYLLVLFTNLMHYDINYVNDQKPLIYGFTYSLLCTYPCFVFLVVRGGVWVGRGGGSCGVCF
jgi:serine/threonine protein kinase